MPVPLPLDYDDQQPPLDSLQQPIAMTPSAARSAATLSAADRILSSMQPLGQATAPAQHSQLQQPLPLELAMPPPHPRPPQPRSAAV